MSVLTYIASAVGIRAGVPDHLPFNPTVEVQLASSFVNRVSPANAANMATLVGAGSPVIALGTQDGAHHYRFIGIEFKPGAGTFTCFTVLSHDTQRRQYHVAGAAPGKEGRRYPTSRSAKPRA